MNYPTKPCACDTYCWKWRNTGHHWNDDVGGWIIYRCRKLPADPIVEYWKLKGISSRTAHALAVDKIGIEAITGYTDAELLRVPMFGKVGLSEIRQFVPSPNVPPPPFDTQELLDAAKFIEKAAIKLRAIARAARKEESI